MFHTGDELNLVGNVDTNGNEISSPKRAIANTKTTGTVSWTKVEDGDEKHDPLLVPSGSLRNWVPMARPK